MVLIKYAYLSTGKTERKRILARTWRWCN